MTGTVAALVTAGVGVVLLVVLLLVAVSRVRRFGRASAALRAGVGERVAVLRALAPARRGRDDAGAA